MEEKLFLVCIECGEAFDEIAVAFNHGSDPEDYCDCRTFDIMPESKAF